VSPSSTPPSTLNGLYVILDPDASRGRPLPDILRQAADGGARLFQYRNKTASMLTAYREAVASAGGRPRRRLLLYAVTSCFVEYQRPF